MYLYKTGKNTLHLIQALTDRSIGRRPWVRRVDFNYYLHYSEFMLKWHKPITVEGLSALSHDGSKASLSALKTMRRNIASVIPGGHHWTCGIAAGLVRIISPTDLCNILRPTLISLTGRLPSRQNLLQMSWSKREPNCLSLEQLTAALSKAIVAKSGLVDSPYTMTPRFLRKWLTRPENLDR